MGLCSLKAALETLLLDVLWTDRENGLRGGKGKQINYNVRVILQQKQVEAESQL